MSTVHAETKTESLKVITKDILAPEVINTSVSNQEVETAANQIVEHLFTVDLHNQTEKVKATNSVESMALNLQEEVARRSQMLKQPIATLARNTEDGGPVAKSLLDLRDKVEDLNPNKYDFNASSVRRILGKLPFVGSPIRRYFSMFQSSSGVLDNIVDSLKQGSDQLKRDNITLTDDQSHFRSLTGKLAQAVILGQLVDQKLSQKLNEITQDDPRYSYIEQELLFPLRQRIIDLQQQQAVAQQAVLTIEVIVRNNKELIRGVQRALNVTVTALSTAVTFALAAENQRIALKSVTSTMEVTNDLIAGTAEKLKTQGVEIHKQAASAMLDIEKLKSAFSNIISALDDIEKFRSDALPAMKNNIAELDGANRECAERIESLVRGRQSQEKMSLGSGDINDIFEMVNKESKS
jgi:uncharacterized protein YaaN involved in tellurite resistance